MVKAEMRVRKILESLYIGKCDIINQQELTDEITHQNYFEDLTIAKDQPCRLSFKSITGTDTSSTVATVAQSIKLFISPDIEVKAGSKIIATQNGRTQNYKASGEPAIYSTHQEIILKLEGDFA